jgi:hypothetical protein
LLRNLVAIQIWDYLADRSGRSIVAAPRLVLLAILLAKKLTIASFSARIATLRLRRGLSFRLSTTESVPQPDASRASPGKSNDSQYVPCELKPGPPLTFAPCGRAINIDLNKLNKNIIKEYKADILG